MQVVMNSMCTISECMYDGQTRAHGSIFTAVGGCNACVCNNGSVDCTNTTACHGKLISNDMILFFTVIVDARPKLMA